MLYEKSIEFKKKCLPSVCFYFPIALESKVKLCYISFAENGEYTFCVCYYFQFWKGLESHELSSLLFEEIANIRSSKFKLVPC